MNKIKATVNKNTPMNTAGQTQLFMVDKEKVYKPNFNQRLGLSKYKGWVAACININSSFIASQTPKLYINTKEKVLYKDVKNNIKNGKELEAGDILFNTCPVNFSQKRFLTGKEDNKPSPYVYRNIKAWGSDYEEVIDSHPVLNLITYSLLYSLVVNLELTGNAYIYILVNKNQEPVRLQVLSPYLVTAKISKNGQVTSYQYGTGKDAKRLAKKNVIHLKYPSNNELEGIGPLQQAWSTLMLDEAVTAQRQGMFDNDCTPNMLISLKNGGTKDQVARFNEYIFTQLLGPEKRGKFLTVGDDVEVTPMSFNPKDIGNDEEGLIRRYAAVFGVPFSRLLGSNINRSTSETMDRGWLRGKISLLLNLLTTSFNEGLLPFYTTGNSLVVAFDNPVQAEKIYELNKYNSYVDRGIMTINEVRSIEGMEDVEWGNEPLKTSAPPSEPIEAPDDEPEEPEEKPKEDDK